MSITCESFMADDDFRKITEINFQRIRNKSNKIGYADGVSDGKEETFQRAFDKGYSDGLRTGLELQNYNTLSNNLRTYNEELGTEQSLIMDLIVNTSADITYTSPGY